MSEQNATAADGLIGMMNVFVDPATTAKRVRGSWSWVWPVIALSIIYVTFGYLMLPYVMQMMDARFAQQNVPPERLENAKRVAQTMSQFSTVVTPLIVIGFVALIAWLIVVTGSIVGTGGRFRDVFSLVAACSIINALQYIASYVVLRSKGDEIQSAEQLQPPFGLDIFASDLHGPLLAIMNFFSIFEIWYLVVLGLGMAVLTGSSKSKAFLAITPAWLLPLLYKIVVSLFSR